MEARIDVRKLQLLNDRIAQTIDALNDVRMSTRGLSHSAPQPQGTPGMPTPMMMSQMPMSPMSQMPMSQMPMSQMPMSQMPMSQMPMSQMPMSQMPMSQMPMSQMPMSQMPMSQMPMSQMPVSQMPMPMSSPVGGSMPCGPSQPGQPSYGSMPSAPPQQPASPPVYTQLFAHVPYMGNGLGLQHSAPMMMPCMPWGMPGHFMPSAHDLERQMCELRACDLLRQAHTFPHAFLSA